MPAVAARCRWFRSTRSSKNRVLVQIEAFSLSTTQVRSLSHKGRGVLKIRRCFFYETHDGHRCARAYVRRLARSVMAIEMSPLLLMPATARR